MTVVLLPGFASRLQAAHLSHVDVRMAPPRYPILTLPIMTSIPHLNLITQFKLTIKPDYETLLSKWTMSAKPVLTSMTGTDATVHKHLACLSLGYHIT